ncbi:XRE family transcriptional regulator [Pseudomonas sp. CM27]|uniref:XRE family transcriptional regulator n=1 Tax=Pseudomonas sp. CM27 TaxID=2738452 RepID=UPI00155361F5|nr:S24 family peptidase [Pseudomonas sp. CM27]NQD73470.1 LexA family transcriptional regulator [Pseudomonas sp. CM27]
MELKDRLKHARRLKGLTQTELAERAGIAQASISEIERGLSRSSSHLVKIAQICGVDALWLAEGVGSIPRPTEDGYALVGEEIQKLSAADMVRQMLEKTGSGLSEEARNRLLQAAEETDSHPSDSSAKVVAKRGSSGDMIRIAHYDVRGAMGGGQVTHDYPEMLKDVRVSLSHLRELGLDFKEPHHLKLVTGWGQSMAPTIKDRDPLIVDVTVREFIGDGVYFISWCGHEYIKRLQVADEDHFEMISDNPKHKDRMIRKEETYIQAKVLYVWNGNLL